MLCMYAYIDAVLIVSLRAARDDKHQVTYDLSDSDSLLLVWCRHLKHCYFTVLEQFTAEELRKQSDELLAMEKELLADKKKAKSRRKTLRKQRWVYHSLTRLYLSKKRKYCPWNADRLCWWKRHTNLTVCFRSLFSSTWLPLIYPQRKDTCKAFRAGHIHSCRHHHPCGRLQWSSRIKELPFI